MERTSIANTSRTLNLLTHCSVKDGILVATCICNDDGFERTSIAKTFDLLTQYSAKDGILREYKRSYSRLHGVSIKESTVDSKV